MKIIEPTLEGIDGAGMMFLAHQRNLARLYKKRLECGTYKMFPLYATENGFELELPDDEPAHFYKTDKQ